MDPFIADLLPVELGYGESRLVNGAKPNVADVCVVSLRLDKSFQNL